MAEWPGQSAGIANSRAVIKAVRERFPQWADPYEPYVNVLTFQAWKE